MQRAECEPIRSSEKAITRRTVPACRSEIELNDPAGVTQPPAAAGPDSFQYGSPPDPDQRAAGARSADRDAVGPERDAASPSRWTTGLGWATAYTRQCALLNTRRRYGRPCSISFASCARGVVERNIR